MRRDAITRRSRERSEQAEKQNQECDPQKFHQSAATIG
jgi:hypothetical protein